VFEPGATLLLVTKGVTESMRGNTPYGAERLLELLRSSKQESAAVLCREVLDAADEFAEPRWQRLLFRRKRVREDMTALAVVRSR
jgi:serine phosphatase RsbU (regulator of sigma subunit)